MNTTRPTRPRPTTRAFRSTSPGCGSPRLGPRSYLNSRRTLAHHARPRRMQNPLLLLRPCVLRRWSARGRLGATAHHPHLAPVSLWRRGVPPSTSGDRRARLVGRRPVCGERQAPSDRRLGQVRFDALRSFCRRGPGHANPFLSYINTCINTSSHGIAD